MRPKDPDEPLYRLRNEDPRDHLFQSLQLSAKDEKFLKGDYKETVDALGLEAALFHSTR